MRIGRLRKGFLRHDGINSGLSQGRLGMVVWAGGCLKGKVAGLVDGWDIKVKEETTGTQITNP